MAKPIDTLLQLQAAVLERIAVGAPLRETLAALCSLVEGAVPGGICSTMLLRRDGTLEVAAAPRASAELVRALDGLVPSAMSGSCGTAVFERRPVLVKDTSSDPRWSTMRELARRFGIQACWSAPIMSRRGAALGSFAISHLEPREPTEFHEQVLRTAGHLASVAVERELADKALQQTQKLEGLGLLAGGIAHDFNNLLVGIMGNAHLALARVDPGSPARRAIERIMEASERASDLVAHLLAYAGKGSVRVETADLCGVARETARLVQSGMPWQVTVDCELPDEALWIRADVTQIRQVAMNLVTNAAEATAGGGRIAIRAGRMVAGAAHLAHCRAGGGLPPGEYPYLEVRDSGAGMDPLTLERIFDPFFTTKAGGRGLGLAATLGIVRAHGGALTIDSTPGAGSTFRVLFPSADAPEQTTARSAESVPAAHPGATVLVVDDQELVGAVTREVLARAGYRVLGASSGAAALEIARQKRNRLDAVVLDVTMPDMQGPDVWAALRAMRGDLPVLFCSGHGPIDGAALVAARPLTAFVQKPFSPATLCRELAGLLAHAGVVAQP